MKKITLMLLTLTFMFTSGMAVADAAADAKADEATVKQFKASPVVQNFHKSAYGYAVFPKIGKGGLGIGGAHGKGRTYVGGKRTGTASMSQVTIGFQAGGQAFAQLIYFEDQRAYDNFTSGKFEFGAQAQAIAVTSSAGAGASTAGGTSGQANTKQTKTEYSNGMVVFTMGKGGLMYEASVGGQKFGWKAD